MDKDNKLTRVERLLLQAARRFNTTFEYEELLEMVLQLVAAAVDAEAALVFRVDHDRTDMKVRYVDFAADSTMREFRLVVGSRVGEWVAQYQQPVIINDAATSALVDRDFWSNVDINLRSLISIPLIGKGQMIGVLKAMNKRTDEFTAQDLDVLIGLAHQIAVAIDNANLYRQARRQVLEKTLLYEVGKKLSMPLSLDEVLREILNYLKQAVDVDSGGVFVVSPETGDVGSIYTVGYGESSDIVRLKKGEGLVGHVAKTGQPIIVSNVDCDEHYVKLSGRTRSEMVVPIELNGRVIGVFNVESEKLNAYTQQDLELMTTFATQAAISIERAQLHQKLLESQKLQEQLNIARQIQLTFLPKRQPSIAHYDVCGKNTPSGDVGGDYYDFIPIFEQHTGIAVADVAGKGIPAALLMASFRASLIAEIRNNYSIRTICSKVNRLMHESMDPSNFVTAVYGVLDSKNHVFTFANCGHNLPFLLRANDEIEYLREGGPVIGVTPLAGYEERPLYIGVGDVVVLYTDGVVEVFDREGREYGLERLIETVRKHRQARAIEIQDAVYADITSFAAFNHAFDDFTVVIFKRLD